MSDDTTVAAIISTTEEIQRDAAIVLEIIKTTYLEVSDEASVAESLLTILAALVTKALTAYAAASGKPITPASIESLMPNPTALTAPNS
jgi:sensor histidine kinase regulating citrate/malate metabolism